MISKIVGEVFKIIANRQHSDVTVTMHGTDRFQQALYLGNELPNAGVVMLTDEVHQLNGRPGREVYSLVLASRHPDDLVPDIFRYDVALGAGLSKESALIAAVFGVIAATHPAVVGILEPDAPYGSVQQTQGPLLGFHGHGVCLIKSKKHARVPL